MLPSKEDDDLVIDQLKDSSKNDVKDKVYSKLKPIKIDFKIKTTRNSTIKPIPIIVDKYSYRFTGVSINNTSFLF